MRNCPRISAGLNANNIGRLSPKPYFLYAEFLAHVFWIIFALPRFQVIDLNIQQSKATQIATAFLNNEQKMDTSQYTSVAMLDGDDATDRYLQKNLGIVGSKQLLDQLHYDLFTWVVRFSRIFLLLGR